MAADTSAPSRDRERRINPEDSRAYTLGELLFLLAGEYTLHEIRDYWKESCWPTADSEADSPGGAYCPAGACAERRLNPSDRQLYTLEEMLQAFAEEYPEEEIRAYWAQKCQPFLGKTAQAGAHQGLAAISAEANGQLGAGSGWEFSPSPSPAEDLDTSQATHWKEVGNKLFRQGNFDSASQEYTRALATLPACATPKAGAAGRLLRAQLLNNRAACAQQLRNWEAAMADTTAALKLDPGNPKALLRRAITAEALEQFDQAFQDACAILAREPGHPQANGIRSRTRDLEREAAARRQRRLKSAEAGGTDGVAGIQEALAHFRYDDMEVLSCGFPWGTTQFLGGNEENLAVLQRFEDELAAKAYTGPPFWWGLDDAMERNPECLRMALDIIVAYLKNYQLDRCEAVARYVLPAARRRGLPWNVKALQDCATLRIKQARQAEAALLLEEINQYVPPNPVHYKNLGVTYNQLRQHQRALECFEAAVQLQDGVMHPSDHWDLGIVKKHMQCFNEALPLLLDALEGFSNEGADPVTLAKVHDNVGACYLEMGKAYKCQAKYAAWAEPYARKAEHLYREAIGTDSPLYGGSARLIAQALQQQGNNQEAEPWMMEALRVEVNKDAIHPTPIHDLVEDLLTMAGASQLEDPVRYHAVLHQAVQNLEKRGLCEDGNGGMVLHKVGRFLALSGMEYKPAALQYFKRALILIRSHRQPPVNISMHCMILQMEIYMCEQLLQSQQLAILDKI